MRGKSQWTARATPTTTAAAPAINAPAARAFAQAPYVPALPRTLSPSSFRAHPQAGATRAGLSKALQREAYCETTQRTTARRDRHGQQANSLPRVAAPHHLSGNASFAGRKIRPRPPLAGCRKIACGLLRPQCSRERIPNLRLNRVSVPFKGRKKGA